MPRLILPNAKFAKREPLAASFLVGLFLLGAFGNFFIEPALAQTQNQTENVVSKWHLKWVGDLNSNFYEDAGEEHYLCVQTEGGKFALWDAEKDTLSHFSKRKCHPKNLAPGVVPHRGSDIEIGYGGESAEPLHDEKSIFLCGKMFSSYFTAEFPDGEQMAFYPIARLAEPTTNYQFWCGPGGPEGNRFTQEFDNISVSFATLSDGTLLVQGDLQAKNGDCTRCYATFAKPTLAKFRASPQMILSFGTDFFIVPKSVVNQSGSDHKDNLAQYQAVMSAIGQGSVHIDDPTPP